MPSGHAENGTDGRLQARGHRMARSRDVGATGGRGQRTERAGGEEALPLRAGGRKGWVAPAAALGWLRSRRKRGALAPPVTKRLAGWVLENGNAAEGRQQ